MYVCVCCMHVVCMLYVPNYMLSTCVFPESSMSDLQYEQGQRLPSLGSQLFVSLRGRNLGFKAHQ